jgi:hypothetical protein
VKKTKKNNIHHPMGDIYVRKNALWADECRGHLPEGYGHSLHGGKDKFMVIYLDDITIFSKSDDEHLQHLEQIFQKCRRYGISLNQRKSHFAMPEGKLLGHIILARGIKIDPKRVEAIQEIEIPRNKKSIQSFIGRMKFFKALCAKILLKS